MPGFNTSTGQINKQEVEMALDRSQYKDLVPAGMDNQIYAFALQVIQAQGRANVLIAQTELRALSDPTGILAKAAALQTHLRKMAGFYQQSTSRQMVSVVAGLDGAYNLAVALQSSSSSAKDAALASAAISDSFRQRAVDITTTTTRTQSTVELITSAIEDFAAELADVTERLDGDDGQIAQVSEAIDKVQANIDQDLENIVKSSREIGAGVKQLVTQALALISAGGDEKSDKKKTTDTPDTAKSGKDKSEKADKADDGASGQGTDKGDGSDQKDRFGDLEPFPVEAIDTVQDGAGQSVAVMNSLRANNRTLAKYLHEKAQLSAALTVCQAIRMQGQSFGQTVKAAHDALSELSAALNDMADRYAELGVAFSKTTDTAPEYPALMQHVRDAGKDWARIQRDLVDIESDFAGLFTLFPPAD